MFGWIWAMALAAEPPREEVERFLDMLDHAEAFETALELAESFHALAETPWEHALALQRLSAVQSRLHQEEQALASIDEGLRIATEAQLPDDQVSSLLIRRATLLHGTGRFHEAQVDLERVLDSVEERTEMRETALLNLSIIQSELGDIALALATMNELERAQRQRLGDDHPDTLFTMINRVGVLYENGLIEEGRGLATEARERLEALGMTDTSLYATALYNLAICIAHDELGSEQARRMLERSLDLRMRIHGPQDPTVAETLYALAVIARERGDAPGAIVLLERALAMSDISEALRLSRQYWGNDDPQLVALEAEFLLAKSLSGDLEGTIDEHRELLRRLEEHHRDNPDMMSTNLRMLSVSQALSGDLDGAIHSLDLAVEASEQLISAMSEGASDRERRASFQMNRSVVDRAMMLRMRREATTRDFEMVLHWKAAAQRLLVPPRAEADPAVLSELDDVRREIARWTLDLDSDPGARRQSLLALSRRKDSLERELAQFDPFGELPSVEEVCRALPDGAALGAWEAAAVELSRRLWSPLGLEADALTQLLVVPDGRLAAVSFAGLPLADGRFLLEAVPISMLSDAVQVTRPAPARPAHGEALVLGGVDYGATLPAATQRALASCGFASLAPLPGTAVEAETVSKLLARDFEVRTLSGAAATETSVAGAAQGAAHLHLATHGFLANEECLPRMEPLGDHWSENQVSVVALNPLALSGLVVAPAVGFDQGDGIWSAEEVASLELVPGALVVLSACNSGLGGELADGAGVMGLGRAFTNAGAGQVVMSLWSVPDAATQWLMTDFYSTCSPWPVLDDGSGHHHGDEPARYSVLSALCSSRWSFGRYTVPGSRSARLVASSR